MTQASDAPIRKSVIIPLDPDAAFALFADGIDRWWPKDTHSLAARDGEGKKTRVRVDPHSGGRVIETLPDGTEKPWADVTLYAPGSRLTLRWYVGGTPDEATFVDIRFTQIETGTRVELTHSGFDGPSASGDNNRAGYDAGWDRVLRICFLRACEKISPVSAFE